MVRVNLIDPKKLADQHLIAEYNEILMLVAYIKNHPDINNIPQNYCLGKGHMLFFKNKLIYIKKRHECLKFEMKNRGFQSNKSIDLEQFKIENKNNWEPNNIDINLITERIIFKLKLKPNYYRYYGKYKSTDFLIGLLRL